MITAKPSLLLNNATIDDIAEALERICIENEDSEGSDDDMGFFIVPALGTKIWCEVVNPPVVGFDGATLVAIRTVKKEGGGKS